MSSAQVSTSFAQNMQNDARRAKIRIDMFTPRLILTREIRHAGSTLITLALHRG